MTLRKISDGWNNKEWVGKKWVSDDICRHPEHNPPGHIVLEPGMYEHILWLHL